MKKPVSTPDRRRTRTRHRKVIATALTASAVAGSCLSYLLFVRPGGWVGRFASTTFERVVVQGALVGGATGVVGLASAAVRRVQTGYLRYYAALLLLGITSLGAYFLIAA